jgi:hypothetical protein
MAATAIAAGKDMTIRIKIALLSGIGVSLASAVSEVNHGKVTSAGSICPGKFFKRYLRLPRKPLFLLMNGNGPPLASETDGEECHHVQE